MSGGGDDPEISALISYLKKHPLTFLPFSSNLKYTSEPILKQTFFDSKADHFYVLYKNRKIYMKKGMSKEQCAEYFTELLMQEDKDSPHCYGLDTLKLTGDEIAVDAGAAEGIFAADVLDRVKKVYCFDMDPNWLDSLKWTFRDTDKVVIVPKGLGDKTADNITTLDDYFNGERIDLIKADIEGAECDTVRGGQNTLRGAKKAIFCTYHRQGDAEELKGLFENLGFVTGFSKGYAFFKAWEPETLQPPYLRRGVIYATKE